MASCQSSARRMRFARTASTWRSNASRAPSDHSPRRWPCHLARNASLISRSRFRVPGVAPQASWARISSLRMRTASTTSGPSRFAHARARASRSLAARPVWVFSSASTLDCVALSCLGATFSMFRDARRFASMTSTHDPSMSTARGPCSPSRSSTAEVAAGASSSAWSPSSLPSSASPSSSSLATGDATGGANAAPRSSKIFASARSPSSSSSSAAATSGARGGGTRGGGGERNGSTVLDSSWPAPKSTTTLGIATAPPSSGGSANAAPTSSSSTSLKSTTTLGTATSPSAGGSAKAAPTGGGAPRSSPAPRT
mmetsp:Transcript_3065/g.10469  ORF Transcript_3065/g.10469 Transcript_3065/m.10469 type:complete len:313 (+) Transcript_3065:1032-1970(+)